MDIGDRLHLRAARSVASARPADVVGDRAQPRELALRQDVALEASERVQEGQLDGVLRVLARAKPAAAERVDPSPMSGVEAGGFGLGGVGVGLRCGAQTSDLASHFRCSKRGRRPPSGGSAPRRRLRCRPSEMSGRTTRTLSIRHLGRAELGSLSPSAATRAPAASCSGGAEGGMTQRHSPMSRRRRGSGRWSRRVPPPPCCRARQTA